MRVRQSSGTALKSSMPNVGFTFRSVKCHRRMATPDDAFYCFRLWREPSAEFERGVDYREQHDPARIGFVCVVQHFPVLADAVGDACEIGRIARYRREPIAPFDRALGSA